jgi:hypothetical protein
MIAQGLVLASAAIFFALGTLHLVYTFHGPKLRPRDATLQTRMAEVHPGITRETTMWKTWIGFNATHSLGAMLYGLIYGWFAVVQPGLLFGSSYLLGVGLVWLLAFAWLGRRYFFSVPNRGILLSLACYVAGVVLSRG